MASRNSSKANVAVETMDKLPSNTLKRNPKMELSKCDLLKLLSYLEGEVQAREIVIATLKAERVKQLLYQAKYGHFALNDPFAALQRDSYGALASGACDEAAIKTLYNNQLGQLENLVLQHRRAQQRLREHLREVVSELEEERQKHALDTAEGDDVTYMLEKERERLRQEVEAERQQKKRLEVELRRAVRLLESERVKQKQIVVLLLTERKLLVSKLLEEHGRREELQQILLAEKDRMADVVDGLEEESQKSLQMEADLERQAADFVVERAALESALECERARVRTLEAEGNALRAQVREMRVGDETPSRSPTSVLRVVTSSSPPLPPVKPDALARYAKVNGAECPYPPAPHSGGLLSCAVSSPKSLSPVASGAGEIRRLVACVTPVGRGASPSPPLANAIRARNSEEPVQVGTASQGGRMSFRLVSSPPQPPKKPVSPAANATSPPPPLTANVCCSSAARGAPPPVPPNKPVLTGPALQKKEAIVRTLVPGGPAGEVPSPDTRQHKVGAQGPRFGAAAACKGPSTVGSGQPQMVVAASSCPFASTEEEGRDDARTQVGESGTRSMRDGMSEEDGGSRMRARTPHPSTTTTTAWRVVRACPTRLALSSSPSPPPAASLDILGEELDDFQRMFVSMKSAAVSDLPR